MLIYPAVAEILTTKLMLPTDPMVTTQVVLRWIHLAAGIVWVGLLYFFNLVNIPLMKELDAGTRSKVFSPLMTRAMWWFRWSAVLTVFVGFGYWNMIVAADARNARSAGIDASGGPAIWTFLLIWTLVAVIEIGALMSPAEIFKKGAVLGVFVAVLMTLASWLYLQFNSHGWESNRLLAIGIGGGMGWFMMFNVWGIIWRVQKKLIRWTEESAKNGTAMPPEAAKLARVALLTSRVNFVLSFPMLFFMAAASHYPMLLQ
jgi:uncharacterized membrane protein